MTQREDEELDEELKFLMEQIDQIDNDKLNIEEKIDEIHHGNF
jgi:hypothetical protein